MLIILSGGSMDKEFFWGLALGMIGGALIVTNCRQAKELVEKGQKEITRQIKKSANKSKIGDKFEDTDTAEL